MPFYPFLSFSIPFWKPFFFLLRVNVLRISIMILRFVQIIHYQLYLMATVILGKLAHLAVVESLREFGIVFDPALQTVERHLGFRSWKVE